MAPTRAAGRARRRLGVAVMLDPPVAHQVDALRRAVADPSLARIPPHLTLVPPVNVRRDDLPRALAVIRAAAGSVPGPLTLTLGPISTFLPVNPVLYLAVGGDLDDLARLRDRVFAPPLERPLSWPWVPHVTVADGASEEMIAAALQAMAGYRALARVDRVVLLEEGPGRTWGPLADYSLGPAARVGTGGLVLELVRGRIVDPLWEAPEAREAPEGLVAPVVVNAYREDQPVGWARATVDRAGTRTEIWVDAEHRRQGIGGHLGAHLSWALAEAAGRPGDGAGPVQEEDYSKATEE
ncbi:MAG: 2'-5' RNA ligase family protein [Actinomycetota bacterium]|nr:2'-5' RNA ligase family protein [Actinomycetota bacterium]